MSGAFTLSERDACAWFDLATKRLQAAEAAGLLLPGWLTSLAAGILVGSNEGALSQQARFFLIIGFSGAYAGLPEELRSAIERSGWEGTEIPEGVPEDLDIIGGVEETKE